MIMKERDCTGVSVNNYIAVHSSLKGLRDRGVCVCVGGGGGAGGESKYLCSW